MATSSHPERENPRTTRVRQIILNAATELLCDHGAREVTATRIAEETGVARTTIYRHWPDQASLLLATTDAAVAPSYDTPSTGEVAADLEQTLSNLRRRLQVRPVRQVFEGLAGLVASDDRFADAQRRFIAGLTQPTVDVLEAAIDRGALASDLDCTVAAATLAGPLLNQFLVMRAEIDDELIALVMAQFVSLHLRGRPATTG